MSIKAVIFDFGGVLVRTGSQVLRRQWEQRLGLRPGEAERLVFGGETEDAVQLGRITDAAHWAWLGDRLGLAADALAQFRSDFFADDAADPALLAYIDRLRAAGLHLGILSNAGANAREIFTERYDIPRHFDAVTISGEEGFMKPDPRLYEIALARAGVQPAEAIFVDDMPRNIEAAQALGLHGVLFDDPARVIRTLAALTGVA